MLEKKHKFNFLILALALLTGCATLGSKTIFQVTPDSQWKYTSMSLVSLGGNIQDGSYIFYCDDRAFVTVNTILLKSETTAYGPILPVFPSDSKRDLSERPLEIYAIVHIKNTVALNLIEEWNISVISDGVEITPSEYEKIETSRPMEGKEYSTWNTVAIHDTYNIQKHESDSLNIKFNLPGYSCVVPELNVKKMTVKDNKFIISPGH